MMNGCLDIQNIVLYFILFIIFSYDCLDVQRMDKGVYVQVMFNMVLESELRFK